MLLIVAVAQGAEPYSLVEAKEILDKIEKGLPIEYDSITIVGDLKISGLKLPKVPMQRTGSDEVMRLPEYGKLVTSTIHITNSTILGLVDLEEIILQKDADFSLTKFNKGATFFGSTFGQSARFSDAHFNQGASFKGAQFYRSANFEYAHFTKSAYFQGAKFFQGAQFFSSHFNRSTDDHAQIYESVDFSDANFSRDASFSGAHFNQTANFFRVHFKDAYFWGAHFNEYACFSNSQFNQSAKFDGVHFNKSVDFSNCMRFENASFMDTQFNQSARFSFAQFGFAQFSRAHFNETAGFTDAHFRFASFSDSQFSQSSDFSWAQFDYADFVDAQFDQVKFNYAQFKDTTSFNWARFKKSAEFVGANFSHESEFVDAIFFYANFDKSQFKKEAFFDRTLFGALSLHRTKYDKLNIRWSNIHDLAYDDTAYFLLIENFKKQGNFDDANECYYSYRCKHGWELLRQGKPLNWLFDSLAWWSYGYGLRPGRPLGWSVSFIILAGIFFWRSKSIKRKEGDSKEVSIWEAFLLSATYFTSGASAIISSTSEEFKPVGKSRYVIVFLRLMGWVFFVLFLSSLSRMV